MMKDHEVVKDFCVRKEMGVYDSAEGRNVRYQQDTLKMWWRTIVAVRGNFGSGIEYIINGDDLRRRRGWGYRYSPLGDLLHYSPGRNVQIPFSAMDGARVLVNGSIPPDFKVVDYREDKWYTVCDTCGREVDWEGNVRVHLNDRTPLCTPTKKDRYGNLTWTRSEHVLGAVVFKTGGSYYLSSTDPQESWRMRAYFLCKLPRKVKSVDDAFESLKPKAVKRAIEQGREIKRQGDIFFVHQPHTTRDLKKVLRCAGYKIEENKWFKVSGDSSHKLTEVLVATRKGSKAVELARGCAYHVPGGWRRPEHRRLTLGKDWYQVHRNTAKGSWSAFGTVD